jgi:hypothetical protein
MLLLPAAGLGLLVAGAALLLKSEPEGHTVSQVRRSIRAIALAGGAENAPVQAGMIGPWRVATATIDPITGEFSDFRIESPPMLISAERAQLHVDAERDTFSFEMWNVVYTRVPKPGETVEGFLWSEDHYVLGPAPYGKDIIPDGAGVTEPPPAGDDPTLVEAGDAHDDAP